MINQIKDMSDKSTGSDKHSVLSSFTEKREGVETNTTHSHFMK
jgi:hypothetical protein